MIGGTNEKIGHYIWTSEKKSSYNIKLYITQWNMIAAEIVMIFDEVNWQPDRYLFSILSDMYACYDSKNFKLSMY